ncbi:MAG: MOSC domain-containing protein [Rectinemataceae bacterium]|nr:MOSC domain-containing protein [Spirochaetaceae bacterium]
MNDSIIMSSSDSQHEPQLPPEGEFRIVSVNVSERTGTRKHPVETARLIPGQGIEGDAHAGVLENRQVSLLAIEEIEKASAQLAALGKEGICALAGAPERLAPGDFAENITTEGIALHLLPLGTRLQIGEVVLEVSKIGKECHAACEIRRLVGDCVMPRKGIFARVIRGGEVHRDDRCHYRF